jgi:hypothetical protein
MDFYFDQPARSPHWFVEKKSLLRDGEIGNQIAP